MYTISSFLGKFYIRNLKWQEPPSTLKTMITSFKKTGILSSIALGMTTKVCFRFMYFNPLNKPIDMERIRLINVPLPLPI